MISLKAMRSVVLFIDLYRSEMKQKNGRSGCSAFRPFLLWIISVFILASLPVNDAFFQRTRFLHGLIDGFLIGTEFLQDSFEVGRNRFKIVFLNVHAFMGLLHRSPAGAVRTAKGKGQAYGLMLTLFAHIRVCVK